MNSRKHQNSMGQSIARCIDAMRDYCEAYRDDHEGPVGDDAIIGDEGMKVVLQGLDRMLVGDLGGYDGGDLHRRIRKIATDHNLLDENGNLE